MPFFIQQTLLNLSHFSPLCFTLGRDFIKTPPDKFCCISRLNCFQECKAVILGDNTYQCRGDIHLSEDRVEVRQLLLLQFSASTDCSLGFVSLTTNNVKISVSSSNLAQLLVRQVVPPVQYPKALQCQSHANIYRSTQDSINLPTQHRPNQLFLSSLQPVDVSSIPSLAPCADLAHQKIPATAGRSQSQAFCRLFLIWFPKTSD